MCSVIVVNVRGIYFITQKKMCIDTIFIKSESVKQIIISNENPATLADVRTLNFSTLHNN